MDSRAQSLLPPLSVPPAKQDVLRGGLMIGASVLAHALIVEWAPATHALFAAATLLVPVSLISLRYGLRGASLGALPLVALGLLAATQAHPGATLWPLSLGIACLGLALGRTRDLTSEIETDLDRHSRAHLALRQRQAQEQALLGALPDTIFRLGRGGKILGASGTRGRLSGALGATYLDQLMPPDAADLVQARAELVFESGEASVLEYHVREHDEVEDYEARLIRCAPDQVLVIVREVTKQKRLERELIAAKETALSAARLKTKFLANMSHEIRTPMNGVIGMTNILLETSLTAEQREYAQIIQKSGQALLSIIDDILDFAKIEAGKLELDEVEFDLAACVEDCVRAFAGQALGKGLDLGCVFDRTLTTQVVGDPTRLRQVLTNLLSNAVKFTDRGRVAVYTKQATFRGPNSVQFIVRDTGPGIAEGGRASLFKPVLLGEGGGSPTREGTGLGLAIARELVQLMGGEIVCDSQVGEGSSFSFTVAFATQAVERRTFDDLALDPAGCRVLVVRPELGAPRLLGEQLGTLSVEAVTTTLEEAPRALALSLERGRPYLAVLVDLDRDLHGAQECIETIRGKSALPDVPIVFITPGDPRPFAHDELRRSATRVLSWPVGQHDLFACLSALVRRGPIEAAVPANDVAAVLSARVLVAEDNVVNQKIAQRTLERLNCTCVLVEDGKQALEAALGGRFDLVLMDCQMPVMDGFEATLAIRAAESAGVHIPVVAMTASTGEEERQRCLKAGMDDFISKPVGVDGLRAVLGRWVKPRLPSKAPAEGRVSALEDAIDLSVLRRLEAVGGGDRGFVGEMIDLFLDQSPRNIDVMRAALNVGDVSAVAKAAHSLKSASAYLGARRLSELCAQVETKAKGKDTSSVARGVEALAAEFDPVRRALLEARRL